MTKSEADYKKSKKIESAFRNLKKAEAIIAPFKPPTLKREESKTGQWHNYRPTIINKEYQ